MSDINDFKYKLSQLTTENEQLRRKVQEAGDLGRKIAEYERRIDQLGGEIRNESSKREQMTRENSTLSQRLTEIDRLSKELQAVQNNILRLTKENEALNADYIASQESLRLSTSQMAKVAAELK